MKKVIIVIILMTILSFHGNAQTSVVVDWSGRHCSGGVGICGIKQTNEESISNSELSYNEDTTVEEWSGDQGQITFDDFS